MPALVAAGLFVLATSVYAVGTLSTSVPRWIVLYLWAVFALCQFVVWAWRRPAVVLDRMDVAALSLYGYMALSLSWSQDWRQGLYSLVNITAMLVILLWIRHSSGEKVRLLAGAACLALAMQFVNELIAPWDWGGHGNKTFQTETLVCLLALSFAVVNIGARMAVLFCALPIVAYLVLDNDAKGEWGVLLLLSPVIAWRTIRYLRPTHSQSVPALKSG